MGTITSNGTGGGVWSAGASWAGGAAPGNNDTAIIAANDTITVDSDFAAAWADGIAGITITSHATTPGLLRFKHDADTTYSLKIKTGTTIAGTNAAAKGRLLANSDGVWGNTGDLAFGRKAIILLDGTAKIDALYLDIALYCPNPTNLYAEVYGTCYVVTCEADDDKLTFVSPSTTPPQAGTPVTLDGTLPAELTAGTTYYVRDVSGSTCKLEASIGGGAINLTDDGSGTIYLHYGAWGPVAQATAVNTTTGVIDWGAVPPAAGTAVVVRSSGTLPTGLTANDCYYVRTVSGNTCKLALQNADVSIVIPSAVGSGNLSMYCGGAATTTAVVNVATDVSGDGGWLTTTDHNAVVLVDTFDMAAYDQQRLTLATKAARYLVLSANVDAQYPGARVWLASRNVQIKSNTTVTDGILVDYGAGAHSGVFKCEIRSTAGTGTTFYGYGVNAGTGHTISGTVSGCIYGVIYGTGHTVSGTVSGCIYGVNSGTGHTVSGTVSGCSVSVNAGTGHTVSGTVSGCTYGFSVGTGHTVSGTVSGCNYGVSVGTGHTISGTVSGCIYGVIYGTGHTVSGTVSGCSVGVQGTGQLYGATFSRNTYDLIVDSGGWQYGNGASLNSATQVYLYKHASKAETEARTGVAIQDLGGTANYLGFWTLGGFCKTAAYASGTHGTPPVASTFVHEMTFEDNDRINWVEIPVYGKAGQAVTVTFYGALTGTAAWTTRPSIGIYDPTKGWQAVAEALIVSAAMASNTDWQTLTATYTPTYDRALNVRVQGVGGNAGGTGTEKLYWFTALSLGGASGGGFPILGGSVVR